MTEKKILGKMQLGKQGVTDSFIESLRGYFKTHENVKVSILKSAGREDKQKFAEEIVEKLGKNYTAKVIGFVINVKKWRRDVRG